MSDPTPTRHAGSADLELRASRLVRGARHLHVGLVNPAAADASRLVPRLLTPLGIWITVAVFDRSGAVIWESTRPKAGLKLHPMRRESYLELAPGYGYGVDLQLPDVPPEEAAEIRVSYSNEPFTGPRKQPIGTLEYTTIVRLGAG